MSPNLNSTKLWLAILGLFLLTLVCLLGKIDGTAFVAGLVAVYAFYSAANVTEKVMVTNADTANKV